MAVLDQERTLRRVSLDLDLVSLRTIASRCGLMPRSILPIPLFIWRRDVMVDFDAVESNAPISLKWGEMDVSPWDLIIASRRISGPVHGDGMFDKYVESIGRKIELRMNCDSAPPSSPSQDSSGTDANLDGIKSMIEYAAENFIATASVNVLGMSEHIIVKYSITTTVLSTSNLTTERSKPEADGRGCQRSLGDRIRVRTRRWLRLPSDQEERFAMVLGNSAGRLHFLLPSFPGAREHHVKILCPDGVEFADSMNFVVHNTRLISRIKAFMTPERVVVSYKGESHLLISGRSFITPKSIDLFVGVRPSRVGFAHTFWITSAMNIAICLAIFIFAKQQAAGANANASALIAVGLATWSSLSSFVIGRGEHVIRSKLLVVLRGGVFVSVVSLIAASICVTLSRYGLTKIALLSALITSIVTMVTSSAVSFRTYRASIVTRAGKVRPHVSE